MNESQQPTQDLPLRFRESAFRVYEPTIAAVVKAFPSPITIKPSVLGFSMETYSCRLRDAIKSFAKYHWVSATINQDKFLDCYKQIGVSQSGEVGVLTIGDRKNLRKSSTGLQTPHALLAMLGVPKSECKLFTIDNGLDNTQLHIICQLADQLLLTQAIVCQPVTLKQKHAYEQLYDISIDLDEKTGIASVL